MKPIIAIVILNWNGQKYLEQFLPTVVQYSFNENFETHLYVADNASTDDSIAFLEQHYPQIQRVVLSINYGFAEGYNQALANIQADFYLLLNSDVEVTENWINPLLKTLQKDGSIAACQPKIKMHADKAFFEYAGGSGGWLDRLGYPFCRGRLFSIVELDEGQYDDTVEVFWATGAALFIKADLYHKVGGFDGDYFAHMEEIDLCWRLKRAGYRIMVCPTSVVYHVGGGTLNKSNPFKNYLNFRNSLVTLLKNENSLKLSWLIPTRLVLDGLAGCLFLVEGKFKDIWSIIRAHFYVYGHLLAILKKRKIAKKTIAQLSIGSFRQQGIYKGSLVWQFYLKKKRFFRELKFHKN